MERSPRTHNRAGPRRSYMPTLFRSRAGAFCTSPILVLLGLCAWLGSVSCASQKAARTEAPAEKPSAPEALRGEGAYLIPPADQRRWDYPAMPQPAPRVKPNYLLKSFLFPQAGSSLDTEAQAVLKDLAAVLQEKPAIQVLVVGFCDAYPEKVNAENLGMARAQNTRKFLVDQGVARSRIEAATFGSTLAKAPQDEPVGQKQDRRVEIWLVSE